MFYLVSFYEYHPRLAIVSITFYTHTPYTLCVCGGGGGSFCCCCCCCFCFVLFVCFLLLFWFLVVVLFFFVFFGGWVGWWWEVSILYCSLSISSVW